MKLFASEKIGQQGAISLVDDDTIEISNLARQLFFRLTDIGKSKAETIKKRLGMYGYKTEHIQTHLQRLCSQNNEIYGDAFWVNQNFIMSAVDSIQARLYLDEKCFFHDIKFLECGTDGLLGHAQLILPYVTQQYKNSI